MLPHFVMAADPGKVFIHKIQGPRICVAKLDGNPTMVLWDKEHKSVVYVYKNASGAYIVIPASMPAAGKAVKYAGRLDAVVNAYVTPLRNLLDNNKYERIR